MANDEKGSNTRLSTLPDKKEEKYGKFWWSLLSWREQEERKKKLEEKELEAAIDKIPSLQEVAEAVIKPLPDPATASMKELSIQNQIKLGLFRQMNPECVGKHDRCSWSIMNCPECETFSVEYRRKWLEERNLFEGGKDAIP